MNVNYSFLYSDTIDISNLLEVVDDQGLMKISDEETLREAFKVGVLY